MGSYDVSISYDKYYQCARVWLYGYSESRQPLSQAEVLQDISVDHALKTVSLEAHPHISTGAGAKAVLTDSETVATATRVRRRAAGECTLRERCTRTRTIMLHVLASSSTMDQNKFADAQSELMARVGN